MVREAENSENRKNLELFCKEWLNAWTGNNPEKLIDFYADDAFYRDPANPEGINGRELLFKYFKKLLERNYWKETIGKKSKLEMGTYRIISYRKRI